MIATFYTILVIKHSDIILKYIHIQVREDISTIST